MSFPEFVLFSIEDEERQPRYMSFTGPQRQLRFGPEEDVFSPTAKFMVEPAANGLVHIRSCYENRYWVRASEYETWLLAKAAEPVEDMTKEGCTLFRPRMSAGDVSVMFVHVASRLNVVMRPPTDSYGYNLCLEEAAPTEFNIVDYSSFIKLHRYVTFKSEALAGGKYSVKEDVGSRGRAHVKFTLNSPTGPDTGVEIIVAKNGDISLKNLASPKLWMASLDAVPAMFVNYADNENPVNPNTTLFQVQTSNTAQGNRGVALKSQAFASGYCAIEPGSSNRVFIFNKSKDDQYVCFRPINLGIPDKCRVTIRRQGFRNPRIYNRTTLGMHSVSIDNPSSHEMMYSLALRVDQTYTFSNSVTVEQGAANFTTPMPLLNQDAQVEIPDQVTSLGSKAWAQSHDFTAEREVTTTVTVPPRTRINVTLLAVRATYDIPFSYQLYDEFHGGGSQTQDLHDGVFSAQCTYSADARIDSSVPLLDNTSPQDLDEQAA